MEAGLRNVDKPICLCCYRDGAETDGLPLYQTNAKFPCAWVHRDCFINCARRHLRDHGGKLRLNEVCIICDLSVPGRGVLPLHANPANENTVAWLHYACLSESDYYNQG
jgi:hypothetical protein